MRTVPRRLAQAWQRRKKPSDAQSTLLTSIRKGRKKAVQHVVFLADSVAERAEQQFLNL